MTDLIEQDTNESLSAEEKKLRLTQRYHLTGNDCLVESAREKPVLAKVVDVSHSGALIHTKKQFGEPDDVVDVYLRMNINDENKIFFVKSRIKNVRTEEGASTLMYGVEFIDVNEELELLLKNYIYKSMTE